MRSSSPPSASNNAGDRHGLAHQTTHARPGTCCRRGDEGRCVATCWTITLSTFTKGHKQHSWIMTHSSGRASRDGRKPPAQPPTGYTSQMVRCARVGSIAPSTHTKSEDARDHRLRRLNLNLSLHLSLSLSPVDYVFAGRKLCRTADWPAAVPLPILRSA